MKTFRIAACVLFFSATLFGATYSGYVVGWGLNNGGQATGIPSTPITNSAGEIIDIPHSADRVIINKQILSNAVAVCAGDGFSLALRNDGRVVGWGNGLNFQTSEKKTPSSDLKNNQILSMSHQTYATNSQIMIAGNILSNVMAIANSRYFSLALKRDGKVISWGRNTVPPELNDVTAIAAGQTSSWVLKSDGTVAGWESLPFRQDYGQLHTVPSLTNIVAIAIDPGDNYTRGYALKRDGTVTTWGSESVYKWETVPEGLSNVTAIAAGPAYALALKSDGTVMAWGVNSEGQATGLPTPTIPYVTNDLVRLNGQILSNIVAIAANWGESMRPYNMALRKDGTVVGWGPSFPVPPPGLSNVVAISAGEGFCLAITTNSAVAAKFGGRAR